MTIIKNLTDEELEAWDARSLKNWLKQNTNNDVVEEMIANAGMLFTTVLETGNMSAGEVLWIMR